MALALRPVELNQIIDRLAPDLRSLIEDYDDSKYPAHGYQLLLEAFGDHTKTSDGDIERALRWKYGHWRKISYPVAQRNLAKRIAREWRRFSREGTHDPASIYEHWMTVLKGETSTPYITITFLLHLLLPDQFPIMDQHTFRAMNWLLQEARPEWPAPRAPRDFFDLMTYREFFDSLHTAWQCRDDRPTHSELDKALMVFGQRLKRGILPVGSGLAKASTEDTPPRIARATNGRAARKLIRSPSRN